MSRLWLPRSKVFRVLFALALFAWTVTATAAFASGLRMAATQYARPASTMHVNMDMVVSNVSAHCAGMQQANSQNSASRFLHPSSKKLPAPWHGAGCPCCNGTGCTCASLCGGMTTIAYVAVSFDPARAIVPVLDSRAPPSAYAAPALRPPIA